MNVPVCTREAEALEVVLGGGWPSCADADLRAHVEQCPICADVVAVAAAMQEEHSLACQQAHVPSAGLVWWRAELRARQEAARKAARPMTLVQGVAAACGLAALLTVASLLSPWVRSQFAGLIDVPVKLPTVDAAAVTGLFAQGGLALLLALGAWLVLVPVALYMVFSRD
jgi:hypothetical protein